MTRPNKWTGSRWLALGIASALTLALAGVPAEAKKKGKKHKAVPTQTGDGDEKAAERGACSLSASALHAACRLDASEEAYETRAICVNVADSEARAECLGEIDDARDEALEECRDQREARFELCETLGEAPYEPDMSPTLFQDPRDPVRTNPYFPLGIGSRWEFEEEEERIEIEVLDATKRIAGVDCIVVNDRVFVDGVLVEDTDDWFGLRTDGSIDYCGESVRDFEVFDGDDPETPELVSRDGSFKAGVEGAKSGTAFPGVPSVGHTYRMEWAANEAEDVGTVLSTTYRYGRDATLDQAVPQALAELFCGAGDCVVVADTSTLEPDAYEHKFYARGVGKFLEVKPGSGAFVPLVGCSHDPRCAQLPLP